MLRRRSTFHHDDRPLNRKLTSLGWELQFQLCSEVPLQPLKGHNLQNQNICGPLRLQVNRTVPKHLDYAPSAFSAKDSCW